VLHRQGEADEPDTGDGDDDEQRESEEDAFHESLGSGSLATDGSAAAPGRRR
jgi:hypothetical protein